MTLEEILINFGATFISVFLAFGLSLWYDRKKKRKEEITMRLRILEAIRTELDLNLQQLGKENEENVIKIGRFTTIALDSAVGGGYFSLLDSETQGRVSRIYNSFRIAQMWLDKILSMVASADMAMTDAEHNLREFQGMLYEVLKFLRKDVPDVMIILEQKILENKHELN